MQHFGKFNTNKASANNYGVADIFCPAFYFCKILKTIEAHYPFQMLARPIEFFCKRSAGNYQYIKSNCFFACGLQVSIFCINKTYIIFYKRNFIFSPKPIFIRLGVLVFHVAHVYVHQRCSGKKMFRFS